LAYDIGLSIMKRQDWAELLKPLAATFGSAAENGVLALIKTGLLIFMPAIVMFAPALIMGLTFPAMTDLFISQSGNVGKGAGTIYGINTIGAIFGPLCIGFLILPAAGLFRSIAIMGGLFFLSGYVMLFSSVKEYKRKAIFVGALFSVIALALLPVMPMDFRKIVEKTLKEDDSRLDEELVYFKEGASGDVMVKKSSRYGKEMYINGLQVASSGAHDLHSHLYPAHCIAFMKEKLDDVCLVAFGCGGTAGSFLLYDEVKHLDAVEICDGVIAPVKRYFSDMNRGVFNDPRFNLIIQDGKNYLKMTGKWYDVIYTGPIHPQSNQGSAALYTREYFEDCRKKLKDGGLQCLWLPLHMASTGDFKTIVRTFMSVYPHAALFVLPNTVTSSRHAHLLGSNAPICINYKLMSERIRRPAVAADLNRLGENGFSSPCEFAAQFAMSDAALSQWTDSIRTLNTDDRPVVEFYDRRNSDIVPTIKSKTELLGEISSRMENPISHIIIPPDDSVDVALQNVLRIAEADKALLNGHMASEYLPLFQETSGQYQKIHAFMIGSYRKAYEMMPENRFLKNYFRK
jgi:spermidine synthase